MLYESIMCLALTIYHESRGEPIRGQIAVAHVVMNRVANREWPNTVCGVMLQNKQFSFVEEVDLKHGLPNNRAGREALTIAKIVYAGKQTSLLFPNATCYTKIAIQRPWMEGLDFGIYGRHKFADCSRKGMSLKKQREKRLIKLKEGSK